MHVSSPPATTHPTAAARVTRPARALRSGRIKRLLGPVIDAQTYRNLAYLLLGLPLGVLGFSLVVTGLSLGLSLLVVALLGIPVLIGCGHVLRALANAERSIANALLSGARIDHPCPPPAEGNLWRRLVEMSGDRVRQRELGFTLLRFPMGVAAFVGASAALAIPASVASAPFYLWDNPEADWGDWAMDSTVESVASTYPWSWLLVPVSLALAVGGLHAINALAAATARWTRAWLTPETAGGSAAGIAVGATDGAPVRVSTAHSTARLHAMLFGAVLALLTFIDIVSSEGIWIHWVVITWGGAVALHAALAAISPMWSVCELRAALWSHVAVFGTVSAMLLAIDVTGGGGMWFFWLVGPWAAIVALHARLIAWVWLPE